MYTGREIPKMHLLRGSLFCSCRVPRDRTACARTDMRALSRRLSGGRPAVSLARA